MKNKIIPIAEPDVSGNELKYVTQCIKTGWISSAGSFVSEFEEKFSKYCDAKYGIATTSGTTALHLALVSLGIGKGDEVIVPSFTFASTVHAISYTGAIPVFVDSEDFTWNIDPFLIEEKITRKTKAIIPVHLYGHPCNMGPIISIAKKHNLYVIEDAAEAHGAEYKGRKVGGLGTLGCFSFFGNKIMTTGEGGIIVTNSKKLADRMRYLRHQAMSKKRKYYHPEIGYNYCMTNIQAAIGVAQLERLDKFIEKKRQIAGWYKEALAGEKSLVLQSEEKWAKSIYWMYSVLLKSNSRLTRDEVIEKLKRHGIETRPFFYPMHLTPPYKSKIKLRVAEKLASSGINLPSGVKLKKQEVEYVARCLLKTIV